MFQTRFVEKIKTHILSSVTFFFFNRAIYEKMRKSIIEWGRPQMAVWCKLIACWIPKAINTHNQVV